MNSTQEAWRHYYCRRWRQPAKVAEEPNEIILRAAQCKSAGWALDIGAGAGRDTLYLARRGFKVSAIDLAVSGIMRMQAVSRREQLDLSAQVADASQYRYEGPYDMIVSVLMLNHLSGAAARSLVRKMKAYMAPGGVVVIAALTKDGDSYRSKVGKDYFYPDAGELPKLFEGWEVVDYRERRTITDAGWWTASPAANTHAELIVRKPRLFFVLD